MNSPLYIFQSAMFSATLRQRLLGGFLFCAVLTALAGGAGILSLQQIRNRMESTTQEIGATINDTAGTTRQLVPLRGLVTSITNARTLSELTPLSTKLNEFREVGTGAGSKYLKVIDDVRTLATHQQRRLDATSRLSLLRKSGVGALQELIKLASSIADDAEFDAVMGIEQATTDATAYERSLITMKSALFVRSQCIEVDASVKSALLATDMAVVDYEYLIIANLLRNTRIELGNLPHGADELSEALERLDGLVKSMFAAKRDMSEAETSVTTTSNTIWKEMADVDDTLLEASETLKTNTEQSMYASAQLVGKWQTAEVMLVVVALILAMAVGILTSAAITKPIGTTVDRLKEIALGEADLTARLDVKSQDEIGQLAAAFNQLLDSLSNLIRHVLVVAERVTTSSSLVLNATSEVNNSAQEIATTIQGISQGSETTAKRVDETAGTVRDMAAAVERVVNSVEQAKNFSASARSTAHEGESAVQEAITGIGAMNEAVTESVLVVGKLGERSDEITSIVKVITGIADQTNLLALNAAIEAARAGNAGRGFAVVAEEVRKLAEGSNQAAEQIAKLVYEIQLETKQAVQAMEAGSEQVTKNQEIVGKTGEALNAIISAVKGSADEVERITGASEELSTGTKHVELAIRDVATNANDSVASTEEATAATEEMSASMQNMVQSAQELSELALNLKDLVGKFQISDEAVADDDAELAIDTGVIPHDTPHVPPEQT